jgi:hypothetical protein
VRDVSDDALHVADLALRVREKLQEALEATPLEPGDALMLRAGSSLRAAGSAYAEPLVGCLDLRVLGLTLALSDGDVGNMWRRFVSCLAPGLITALPAISATPYSAGNGDGTADAPESLALLRRAAAAATRGTGGRLGLDSLVRGAGQLWLDTLRAFALHELRVLCGSNPTTAYGWCWWPRRCSLDRG